MAVLDWLYSQLGGNSDQPDSSSPQALDYLKKLLSGGDPEATGAAVASAAMAPVTGGIGGAVAGDLGDLARGIYSGVIQQPGQKLEGGQPLPPEMSSTGGAPGTMDATGDALNTAMMLLGGGFRPAGSFGVGGIPRGAKPAPLRGALDNQSPFPEAKFPQYAEEYPPVGPPVTKIDPKSGKPFLAKDWTPEAEAFAQERTRIAKDMGASGYEPYYDPAQRFHVDPANYPPNLDTATIVPAKQATIDRHLANIGAEETRARLQAAYQRGTEMPNTTDWYALGQVERDFVDRMGPEAGRKAFQDKLAASMAATTGGADPTANWLMATYGNYLRDKVLPYPQAAYEMPYPVGGRFATGNLEQHQKIFDAGGFSSLGTANPKRHDFSQSFTGNRNVAPMDEQMVSGMTPGVNVPPSNTYGLYTGVAGEEAVKAGVFPQNYQDVAWSGFKNLKDPTYTSGKPFIEEINDSIERTHRLTGMPRDEIVRRGLMGIGGHIPMYGLLSAAGLGAASQYGEP